MDIYTELLSSIKSNFGLVNIINLLVTLFGFFWVLGAKNVANNYHRWKFWTIFWGATAGFYLLVAITSNPWWFSFLALDISVAALLICLIVDYKQKKEKEKTLLVGAVFLVFSARVADIYYVNLTGGMSFVHQLLISFVFVGWAWRHKIEDVTQSLVLLAYAFLQFPFKQAISYFDIQTSMSAESYVITTYVAYFMGKFALIVASYSIIGVREK